MAKIKFNPISDQIALLRSPAFRGVAQTAFRTTTWACHHLARNALFVSSGIVLLFRCTQYVLAGILSCAQHILFPAAPAAPVSHKQQKKSEQFKSLLDRWMRGNLQTPLNPLQKEAIRKAIEGTLSPQQEEELINAILRQKRQGLLENDDKHRSILTNYLQKAKAATAQEKLEAPPLSLSFSERIKDRQEKERAALVSLKEKLTLIDSEMIQRRIDNVFEKNYLNERATFIRETLPNLDPDNFLWDACFDKNPGQDVEQEINLFQQKRTEDGDGKATWQVLLEAEYCALLRHSYALNKDSFAWEQYNGEIPELNTTVHQCFSILSDAIEQRWGITKEVITSNSETIQKIDALLKAFKALKPTEDPSLYFKRAEELMAALHQLELNFLKKASNPEGYFSQTGELLLANTKNRIQTVIDIPPRLELLGIKEIKDRKAERYDALSRELLRACLKNIPDGQQLIGLMALQPHSEGDWHLYDASHKAFETLYTKVSPLLRNHLYSIPEFVADIQIQQTEFIPSLHHLQKHTWESDIPNLEKNLNLQMNFWHRALQEIWIKHLPFEQEKEIRSLSGEKREEKMSTLFAQWMLVKTGLPFTRTLSFQHLKLPNQENARTEALRTIGKKKLPRRTRPLAGNRIAPLAFRGAPLDSITLEPPIDSDSRIIVNPTPFDAEGAHLLVAPEDLVTRTKKSPAYNPKDSLNNRIKWAIDASCNPIYQRGLKFGSLHLYSAFFDISRSLNRTAAPQKLLQAFINLVLAENTLQRDNAWRKAILVSYLEMTFAGEGFPIQISEQERKCLVQMTTLAEVPMPKFAVLDNSDRFIRKGLFRISSAVQESEVSLEGLEEDLIQRSAQESTLPQTPEMRLSIDALRARYGQHLAEGLLPAVFQAYRTDHDQGQQAIMRAISYAFRDRPDAEIAHLTYLLARQPGGELEIDPRTMALPWEVVLLDRLIELPLDLTRLTDFRKKVETFNQALINSNNAPKMLMGLAREISRCTQIFTSDRNPTNFVNLLKIKIAYQTLKSTYFENKTALGGFLQLAIDQAELSIAASLDLVKVFSSTCDLKTIPSLLLMMDVDPTRRSFPEKTVEKAFRIQQEHGLPVTYQPPFFLSFGRSDLDLISGFIYFDGQENLDLPAHLQNHPHVRSLGLHDLPYVCNPDGSYSYFTKEKGQRVAQVRITMTPGNDIIIQRRLPTHFFSPDIEALQYLPLEKFKAIPTALAQRMGVREFWQASDTTIYGYTEKGVLALSIQGETINTSSGPFKFPKQGAFPESPSEAAFNYLLHALPADEILQRDQNVFWVPSLNLKIEFDPADQTWNCTSPEISGMTLDLTSPPLPSVLTLKPKEKAAEALLQTLNDRLTILRKHLEEAQQITGPSLFNKAEIKEIQQDILRTESEIAQMEARLYIAVLPEQKPGTSSRAALAHQVGILTNLSRQIAQTEDHAASQKLQITYLIEQKKYHDLLETYQTTSATARRAAILETSNSKHVLARDLAGSAFLVAQELRKCHPPQMQINPLAWIQELAKHPFSQPLDPRTLDLVQDAAHISFSLRNELTLYLHLLLCQNAFFHLQNIAKALFPDQESKLKKAQKSYRELQRFCKGVAEDLYEELPSEIRVLLHTHCPGVIPLKPHIQKKIAPFPEIAAKELLALSCQSLLERLNLFPLVVPHPKNHASAISRAQRELLRSFRTHSPDQVDGFYLEEFGLFSVRALERQFSVDEKGNGLFGLKRKHLAALFESMKSKGWIEQRSKEDFLFSVTASKVHPLALGQEGDLLAILADLPLCEGDRKKIADRLRKFLFLAAQSSFTFSWKDPAAIRTFNAALKAEREIHEGKMLDAKAFLEERLSTADISLIEFKRRVLLEDHNGLPSDFDFAAARNALLRYLVHKTEIQHLDKVAKAPLEGERNQIELLSTARQYPINLLLFEAETADKKKEEKMPLAFLFFEEDCEVRCNAMQIQLFRSLMLDQEHPEAITAMQARMGFGKTALLPLLALTQIAQEADKPPEIKSLVRYVVPKAVLEDNKETFNTRIARILGLNVLKDREFSRYQIDPDNKEGSLAWILEDLKSRLAFYENARNKSLVLIQSPEIRQSMEAQELAFGFLAINGSLNDEEQKLCLKCKQILRRIRSLTTYTIFDELDATQDFRACDVNFTEGGKLPIDQHAIRPLSELIACVAENREAPREVLTLLMLRRLGLSEDLSTYVTDPKAMITPDLRLYLNHLEINSPEQHAGVFLIRAILLDPNFFAFVSSKQPNTHFGIRFTVVEEKKIYSRDPESESDLLIAVPYDGANTPKGMSTFDNTEIAAIATMRYYLSPETILEKDPHLEFLVTQTKRQTLPPFLTDIVRDVRDPAGNSFTDRLLRLSELLDAAEIQQAKELFYQHFFINPSPEVRSYFGMAVVATQVRTDEARANSNRYEMGSPKDQIRGCSGTVSSTSSYFEKAATDPAADAKLSIEIMGRENNAPIAVLSQIPEDEQDYLGHVLKSLLDHAKTETRAIIDVAGICKSRDGTRETIVARLWEFLQTHSTIKGIEGIVYYGKDNVKRVYRGPGRPPIPCTTQMELEALPKKKYFSFYGQKNTRGSDIKQADQAHALVTMDENVPNNDAKQGILRFRSLVQRSSGQTFTFVLTDRFHQILKKRNEGRTIGAKDVAKDLRRREREGEQHDALTLFRKELKEHVKQAAAYIEHQIFSEIELSDPDMSHAYLQFLEERHTIIPMVEQAIHALEEKYGSSLVDLPRNEFVREQTKIFQNKLNKLDALSRKTINYLKLTTSVNLAFFHQRINFSQQLFETRYPQNQNVEVSVVDTGAEAVAMALAQAQAQGLAESISEKLSENLIHNLSRLPDLGLAMTQEPSFFTPEDWFTNPTGTPINNFKTLRFLIHPNFRHEIHLSPHMGKQRIVSHFALIQTVHPHIHLFISQKEAEKWESLHANARNPDFQLVDLRVNPLNLTHNINPLLLKNMQAAVLQKKDKIVLPRTTDELRLIELTNVTARQLLPTLFVNGHSDKFNFKSFGISKEGGPVQLVLDRQPRVLQIRAGNVSFEIPIKNEWLSPLFKTMYEDPAPGKYIRVRSEFEKAAEEFQRQLEALHKEEETLTQKLNDAHKLVKDISAFSSSAELKTGLKERDKTFATQRHDEPDAVKTCGKAFLDKMECIANAQKRLSTNFSQQNLDILIAVFHEFASPQMTQFDGNFQEDQVFDKTFWSQRKEILPPFDLVYGRILHSVHASSVQGARKCEVDDCNAIFNRILPQMRCTIENIQKAVVQVPLIQADIDKIQAKITSFKNKNRSFLEAFNCIERMNRAQELLDRLAEEGILLVDPKDNPLLVWDRFNLQDLDKWPEGQNELIFQAHPPDFQQTIKGMEKYKQTIHALNSEESDVKKDFQSLLRASLNLAMNIENREQEIEQQFS